MFLPLVSVCCSEILLFPWMLGNTIMMFGMLAVLPILIQQLLSCIKIHFLPRRPVTLGHLGRDVAVVKFEAQPSVTF